MVHKKYTFKNGKLYGPYLYENKREGDKVVTTYVGKQESVGEPSRHFFAVAVAFLLLAAAIFMFVHFSPTGRVTFDLASSYNYGEPLQGSLRFALKSGELLPADTIVRLSNGGTSIEIPLSQLTNAAQASGNFFAENSSLPGNGTGFGVPGSIIISPNVLFQLAISGTSGATSSGSSGLGTPNTENNTSVGQNQTNTPEQNTTVVQNNTQSSAPAQTSNESSSSSGASSTSVNGSTTDTSTPATTTTTNPTPTTDTGSTTGSTTSTTTAPDSSQTTASATTTTSTTSTSTPSASDTSSSSSTATSTSDSSASTSTSAPSDTSSSSPGTTLTGNAIAIDQNSNTVSGITNAANPFQYQLGTNEGASVVHGSVTLENGTALPDNTVSLQQSGQQITVSTTYNMISTGFGPEYLGSQAQTLVINLSQFGLNVTAEGLSIELIYNNSSIANAEFNLSVVGATNQSSNITTPGNETNVTIITNETNVTLSNISQIKPIPTIRIAPNGSALIDLGNYFSGATSYNISISDMNTSFVGSILNITPAQGFVGGRIGHVLAINGNDSLESNGFAVLVSSNALSITTLRSKIVVGEPVQWIKNVSLGSPENVTLQLPGNALNITITKVDNSTQEQPALASINGVTGNVINFGEPRRKTLLSILSEFFRRFTGFAVADNSTINPAVDANSTINITLADNATNYVVQYYTPAPTLSPVINNSNMFVVSGPDGLNYTDVVASTTLDVPIPAAEMGNLKLYWYNYNFDRNISLKKAADVNNVTVIDQTVQQPDNITIISANESANSLTNSTNLSLGSITGNVISQDSATLESKFNGPAADGSPQGVEGVDYQLQEVPFDSYDLSGDGNINYIEWVVPHLSSQTFRLVLSGANSSANNVTFLGNYSVLAINANSAPYNQLVGYWNFDGDSSSTVFDVSGRGGNGTFNNGASTANASYGRALDLNGSTGIQVYPTVPSITNFQNFTVMLWFKRHTLLDNTPGVLRGFGGSGWGESWRFSGNAPGNTNIGFVLSNSSNLYGQDLTLTAAETWYHMALTYDNSTGNATGYVNGRPITSLYIARGVYYPSPGSTDLQLGTCNGCGNLNGSIDEVMLFNDTLTPQQISSIYNNQSTRFVPQGTVTGLQFNISKLGDTSINITLDDFKKDFGSNIAERIGRWDPSQGYNDTDSNLFLYLHGDGNLTDSSGTGNSATAGGGAASLTTNTYTSTGVSTYTVPSGVTTVMVKTWGAGGYDNGLGSGGGGGFTQGNLSVQAGDTLTIQAGSPRGTPTYVQWKRGATTMGWIVAGSGGDGGNDEGLDGGQQGGSGGGTSGGGGGTAGGCCGYGGGGASWTGAGSGGGGYSSAGSSGSGPLSSSITYNGGSGGGGGGYGGAGWYDPARVPLR